MHAHRFPRITELRLMDPALALRLETGLAEVDQDLPETVKVLVVNEVIRGLTQETTFGRAIADGFLTLARHGAVTELGRYQELVRSAASKGPAFGWVVATYVPPVLKTGDQGLLQTFLATLEVMSKKGAYTFPKPLKELQSLLQNGDRHCARQYLELLTVTFAKDLTYNQCQHYTVTLPKAVMAMPARQRPWQIQYLTQMMAVDFRLADAYLKGLPKGLYLLSEKTTGQFIASGVDIFNQNAERGLKYFRLDSKRGLEALSTMQVAVALSQLQPQLNRYLRARTGLALSVCALSQLPNRLAADGNQAIAVCSDGKRIYLPEQIRHGDHKADNQALYQCLVRFEAGYYEFGTFSFDLDKWRSRNRGPDGNTGTAPRCQVTMGHRMSAAHTDGSFSDLERFFRLFANPDLAQDLFTIFEHGRLRGLYGSQYPGLLRRYLPILQREAQRLRSCSNRLNLLSLLYDAIALGIPTDTVSAVPAALTPPVTALIDASLDRLTAPAAVEVSVDLVVAAYPELESLLSRYPGYDGTYRGFKIPFHRRIRPDLVYGAHKGIEGLAEMLQQKFRQSGLHIFRSDLKQVLAHAHGKLVADDLDWIAAKATDLETRAPVSPERIAALLEQLRDTEPKLGGIPPAIASGVSDDAVSWYWEWDDHMDDYLYDHVRVVDREVPPLGDSFYEQTLAQYAGLVSRIRNAFELMKPKGLKRLRQWVEGDEFDYRALVDHVVDRWVGQMPTDRLYIKKIKHRRDVAALLLVDLSRSTANRVSGTTTSVLDVEKVAIVLFAEALAVVGDEFAIAGFSGTGRLGVDYFHIKDFSDTMSKTVKQRINAMAPQRNTRMGAAIRHAAEQFKDVDSKVRLLILLGDGFPNDTEYKQSYAVSDTSKSIAELRTADIHVHAITVNIEIKSTAQLDRLFGQVHHTCIADIAELPDKLVRIYGSLTRY